MFNPERFDWRGNNALPSRADFHAQPDSEKSHLEHAAAESRTADGRFNRLGEIATALDQGFAGLGFDDEDEIVVIECASADHVERSERSQRDAVQRAAQLGEAIQ